MFAAVILVCGLPNGLGPEIVNGCGLIVSKSPFPTENLCMTSNMAFVELGKDSLPEGSYFQDVQCVKLGISS